MKPAVLTVGGWYDGEDPYGPLRLNQSFEEMSKSTARTFVMGPWTHGAWNRGGDESLGVLKFDGKPGQFFRDSIGFPFFAWLLKDKCGAALPKVVAFETGANKWRTFDVWPPKSVTPKAMFLGNDGQLSPTKPTTPSASGVGIHFTTTGTNADIIVKVIDVNPDMPAGGRGGGNAMDGYQQLVKGDVYRARWRRSLEKPEPLVPGKVDSVNYVLHDVFHTFKKGHRLMVHVQSSWFPLIDRNSQKFVLNINTANATDFQTATMTILRNSAHASYVRLPALAKE